MSPQNDRRSPAARDEHGIGPSLAALDGRLIVEPDVMRVRTWRSRSPRGEIRVKDGRAAAENVAITAPGTTVSVSGTMALEGDRALDARISASGALGFLSSLVPGRAAGEFKADLRASGTIADPGLTGNLSLDGAAWVWPEQRIAFRDWSGQATVDREAVTIGALDGHLNGGDASVSGEVRFKGGGRGLTLRVRDAFAEVIKGLRSQADADLTLASSGDGARALGQGDGHVRRVPRTHHGDGTAVRHGAGGGREGEPAAVAAGRGRAGCRIDSRGAHHHREQRGRLDLVPSMKLQGTLAEPALVGTLDMVDDGRLTLLGRTFRLSEASVVFAGTSDPAVQIIGETRVGNYAVTLRTAGPVSRLKPTFHVRAAAEPARPSVAAGDRPHDRHRRLKGSDDQQFALGAASSDLLGFAARSWVSNRCNSAGRTSSWARATSTRPCASPVQAHDRPDAPGPVAGPGQQQVHVDRDSSRLGAAMRFACPERQRRGRRRIPAGAALRAGRLAADGAGEEEPREGTAGVFGGFSGDLLFPVSELESVLKLKKGKPFDAGRWQEDRARLEGSTEPRLCDGQDRPRADDRERRRDRSRRVALSSRSRTSNDPAGEWIGLSDGDRRDLMRVWSGSVLPEFLDDDISAHLARSWLSAGTSAVDRDQRHHAHPGRGSCGCRGDARAGDRTRKLVIEGAREVTEPELAAGLSGSAALEAAWVDPAARGGGRGPLRAARVRGSRVARNRSRSRAVPPSAGCASRKARVRRRECHHHRCGRRAGGGGTGRGRP